MTGRFTKEDLGCWADGALGHDHVRSVLADLLEQSARRYTSEHAWAMRQTASSLRQPMGDDASDEGEALTYLNDDCEDGVHFELVDGDLVLMEG